MRHVGPIPFSVLGPPFEQVLRGAAVLLIFWSILYWMYRKKIFIRI
jgi:heparan-alpha-glucosaminide N-acetyltransferase